MLIDHIWICKQFGINSDCFQIYQENIASFLNDPKILTSLKKWQASKFTQNHIRLKSSSLNLTEDGPIKETSLFFFRYSYLFQVLNACVHFLAPKFNLSKDYWVYYYWTHDYQKELFPNLKETFPSDFKGNVVIAKEDLFGDLLNEILMINLREEKGMFYTPQILSNFFMEILVKTQIFRQSRKLIDPTCGSGSILLPLIKKIINTTENIEQKKNHILNIYGNDENPVAILATLANIVNLLREYNFSSGFYQKMCQNFSCQDVFKFHNLSENHDYKHHFDIIIGNLPWNVINNIQNPQIKELIISVGKEFDIFMTWKNQSNLEIATVLFKILQHNLLTENGHIGFLLPASLLTATQHSKFRRFEGLKNLHSYHIIPDFFPIHSMYLIAQNDQNASRNDNFPIITAEYYHLFEESNSWSKTRKECLEASHISYHRGKPLVGKYYAKSTEKFILPIKKSGYYSSVKRGVDITPRRLIFIQSTKSVNVAFKNPETQKLEIFPDLDQMKSTQSSRWDFTPYKSSQIDSSDLHLVVKSTDLIPFALNNFHYAFLPLKIYDGHYILKKNEELGAHSRDHLNLLEDIYKKHRKPTAKNQTLMDSLNYGKKIQNPDMIAPIKVVYPVGGSYCKAAIINHPNIVIDVTFYYIACNDKNEAYYLLAWLNSSLLQKNLPRVCTIGANGSIRVIHMAPWMFPLPKFNFQQEQMKIVELSKQLEKVSRNVLISNKIISNHSFPHFTNKLLKKSRRNVYKILKTSSKYVEIISKIDNLFLSMIKLNAE
ncbi:N-6 DNA methylase [Candidatus Lokiarchaeum ossiferum]|uniref:N-6 DNA methylase n=1 Tax=Candidatus Lokiarchaeum ossiferum TaxID=2951803 RepID=UPI00352E7DCB